MKLVLSRKATHDLVSIGDYIVKDNLRKAREHLDQIVQKTRRILKFPRSGRIVPEFGDVCIREIIFGHYRIVYRFEKNKIIILTVFEGHRLLSLKH